MVTATIGISSMSFCGPARGLARAAAAGHGVRFTTRRLREVAWLTRVIPFDRDRSHRPHAKFIVAAEAVQ